jgi:hypothetical protein
MMIRGEHGSMVRVSLFISGDQKKQLDALQVKFGTPISEAIRRALDLWLPKQKS